MLPADEEPKGVHSIDARPLSESEIEAVLIRTVSPQKFATYPADEDLRISIAGVQEKTTFLHHNGRWCRPLGATPTTHIFKLPLGLVGGMQADMRASDKISWYNARLAMSVRGRNKHYVLKDIQRRHFNDLAASCGLGETAEPLIKEVLAATPAVIESVQKKLPRRFPQRVLDTILNGLSQSARRLESMPAARR